MSIPGSRGTVGEMNNYSGPQSLKHLLLAFHRIKTANSLRKVQIPQHKIPFTNWFSQLSHIISSCSLSQYPDSKKGSDSRSPQPCYHALSPEEIHPLTSSASLPETSYSQGLTGRHNTPRNFLRLHPLNYLHLPPHSLCKV